jgi:hypothetical protein
MGHKFYNLETSSTIHAWIDIQLIYMIFYIQWGQEKSVVHYEELEDTKMATRTVNRRITENTTIKKTRTNNDL